MKCFVFTLFVLGQLAAGASDKNTGAVLIEMEKKALERWNQGDPTGFLEISAPDVVYFDPFLEKRLNGLDELTRLYLPLKGQIKVERYEMLDPLVQLTDRMAVLTFNLNQYVKGECSKWNCTEVYRLEEDGRWKIIQTHWSMTRPKLNP